jgi:hypothetical protein
VGTLRKIPKWGWVTGGLGLALVALLLYEHYHNAEETGENESPPTDTSQYPPRQMSMPSGAAGGTSYYLPLSNGQPPAQGASDGLPETPNTEEPPGPVEEPPAPPAPPVVENTPIVAPPSPPPVHGPTITPEGVVNPPAVGPGHIAPGGWCGHPDAIGLNRPCSDQDKLKPPQGWHFFCCNGMLGRAPDVEGVGPGTPVPSPTPTPAAVCNYTTDICHAQTEITRLQNEINGLQNHIDQLTNVIQQYPNAKQRNQWEAERNQDRSNIDGKRNEVNQWSNQASNLRGQPGCAGVAC